MSAKSTPTSTDTAEQFLPARQVWERYGVTSMTLWRWLSDPDLRFPKPMRIGRFRYWRLSDLAAWEKSRCGKSVSEINLEVELYATAEKTVARGCSREQGPFHALHKIVAE